MDPIRERNVFLLRWNPQISSFKMSAYMQATTDFPEGFDMDWSVHEWEDAHEGDIYFMLRVGEGNTGLIWEGDFLSEPYEGEDWAGKGIPRHYVDISCWNCADPETKAWVTTEELEKAIHEINWRTGHSGEKIDESVYQKIMALWTR